MKVKQFEATNMKEALEKIKQEMGPEAFILGTRSVRKKGPLGFGERTFLQVTAALDEKEHISVTQESEKPAYEAPAAPTVERKSTSKAAAKPETEEDPYRAGFDTVFARSRQAAQGRRVQKDGEMAASEDSDGQKPLRTEISELKHLVQNMSSQRNSQQLERELAELKSLLFNVVRSQNQLQLKNQTPALIQTFNRLLDLGFESSLAAKLVQLAEDRLPLRHLAQMEKIEARIHDLIRKAVEVQQPVQTKQARRIVALIGPTGVGKTTTLAKLAAHHALEERGSVAFVTLDTYRIAAVDQLRTYAHIMDIPLQVALNPAELAQAIQFHEKKSLILIDTAGYSHNDASSMEQLGHFFRDRSDVEMHLVLSATTKSSDLSEIVNHFEKLKPSHFILSKLDETSNYGALFTQLIRAKRSVSYVTFGQSVPEDIARPTHDYLADLFLGRTQHGKEVRHA
jgi:flagellar biosynthesis protein FlhF